MQPTIDSGAIFSPDRLYRYQLWRIWNKSKPMIMFIGLNPSTADEIENDPTITREINFAGKWGYGGMFMGNIFAFRSTDPQKLTFPFCDDPIGDDNDKHLLEMARQSNQIIIAWGNWGELANRGNHVIKLLPKPLYCLGITSRGCPKHPLYLSNGVKPIIFPVQSGKE